MANPKVTYEYQGNQLTVPEIHAIYGKKRCGQTWLRERLKEHSVEEVLKMRPKSHGAISRTGANKSPWGRKSFEANMLLKKEREAMKSEIETKAPFHKMLHNAKVV